MAKPTTAAHGGPRTGAGRPRLPKKEKRTALSLRVLPETRSTLERIRATLPDDASLGEVVDLLARSYVSERVPVASRLPRGGGGSC